MKNTVSLLLYVSIALCAVFHVGCKKDEINPELTPFGEKAGAEIVNHETYIEDHRGGLSHPEDCQQIAVLGVQEFRTTLISEIPSEIDGFVTVATKVYRNPKDYKKWWDRRFGRSDLIKELGDDAIVDEQIRRVMSYYPQGFKDRIIPYVIDGICYGGGTRNADIDYSLQYMFDDTIPSNIEHESWVVIYSEELYYYYYYLAVNPANYADAKKMNIPTPTIEEMQIMFPVEEIQKQTDLNMYREDVLKKYDFVTQKGWKPASAPVTSTKGTH